MIEIGDKVKKQIHYGCEGGSLLPAMEGTVVYVHPEGRYYTAEFEFESRQGAAVIRESFPWKSRQIVETAEDELKRCAHGPRLPGQRKQPTFYANYLESDQKKHKRERGMR